MNRTVLIGLLLLLAIIAVGLWIWRLRATQYPKEYTGPMPKGPGAPMEMEKPMGIGGQATPPTPTPQ